MTFRFGRLLGLICTILGVFTHAHSFALADLSHGKAALVNGAVITSDNFHNELRRIERLKGAAPKSLDRADSASAKKQALENLIASELLYQEAGKRGIKVPEKVVTEEIGKLKKQFSKEADFNATLKSMGLSESAIRVQVEKGMAIRKFIDANFADKVKVTDEDIAFYYDDHRDEFKAAGRQRVEFIPLNEAREKIRGKIRQERVEKALSPYLKNLRETAKVEILLDEESAY